MILVKTVHQRLWDHGCGREPLFAVDTTLGYFVEWLGSAIATCDPDWLAARKFKTVQAAIETHHKIPGSQVIRLVDYGQPGNLE